MSVTLTAESGASFLAAHDRKRLTDELEAADAVYTQAVQAAVAKQTDWARVRQAAEVVRQCRAAAKALGGDDE